jgi:hypothetical protein
MVRIGKYVFEISISPRTSSARACSAVAHHGKHLRRIEPCLARQSEGLARHHRVHGDHQVGDIFRLGAVSEGAEIMRRPGKACEDR